MVRWVRRITTMLVTEYMTEYRETRTRVYDAIVKNNLHLNTVILTVSIASLTAVAALSSEVFEMYPWLSLIVITLFITVILVSTVNFYLSAIALRDLQSNLNKDILFIFKASRGEYKQPYTETQKVLNKMVLSGFCLGLIMLLVLLGCYILGAAP